MFTEDRVFLFSGYALIISNANFYQIPGDPLSRELPQRQGAENDSGMSIFSICIQ